MATNTFSTSSVQHSADIIGYRLSTLHVSTKLVRDNYPASRIHRRSASIEASKKIESTRLSKHGQLLFETSAQARNANFYSYHQAYCCYFNAGCLAVVSSSCSASRNSSARPLPRE